MMQGLEARRSSHRAVSDWVSYFCRRMACSAVSLCRVHAHFLHQRRGKYPNSRYSHNQSYPSPCKNCRNIGNQLIGLVIGCLHRFYVRKVDMCFKFGESIILVVCQMVKGLYGKRIKGSKRNKGVKREMELFFENSSGSPTRGKYFDDHLHISPHQFKNDERGKHTADQNCSPPAKRSQCRNHRIGPITDALHGIECCGHLTIESRVTGKKLPLQRCIVIRVDGECGKRCNESAEERKSDFECCVMATTDVHGAKCTLLLIRPEQCSRDRCERHIYPRKSCLFITPCNCIGL